MSPDEARELISEIAFDSGRIFVVRHAQDRMIERGIDFLDVQRCLKHGAIIEGPYVHNIRSGNWRVKMSAVVSGDEVQVVAEIADSESEKVIVITAF